MPATQLDLPAINFDHDIDRHIDRDADREIDRDARINELSELVGAFSDIGEKLRASHAALTDKVAKLQGEIAEKNRLLGDQQRELERRNRLAALGEMAAGLAHEIRNPLGGIGLCTDILEDLLGDMVGHAPNNPYHASTQESREVLGQIRLGVQRMERTVSQVLRFAGDTVAEPTSCDVAALVKETISLCRSHAEKGNVKVRYAGPGAMIGRVDPTLLGQALMNLLLNAIEVAGHVTVRLEATQHGGRNAVKMVVTDDGPGLPESVIDRIFDPFFTTRDTGTGLGLSIVHRIAEAHDGRVAATNNTNQPGASFELVL